MVVPPACVQLRTVNLMLSGQTDEDIELRVLNFLAFCEEVRAIANQMKSRNCALMVRAQKGLGLSVGYRGEKKEHCCKPPLTKLIEEFAPIVV